MLKFSNGSTSDINSRYSTIKCNLIDDDYELIKLKIRENKLECLVLQMEYGGPVLSSRGMKKICRALKKNASIKEIALATNNKDDGTWMKYLCEALMINTSVTKLFLYDYPFPEQAVDYLSSLLKDSTCKLELLDMMYVRDLSTKALEKLFGALKMNTKINTLHLREMNDTSLKHLADTLKANHNIVDLLVHDMIGHLTDSGVSYLCQSLQGNKTITKLTLQGVGLGDVTGKSIIELLSEHENNLKAIDISTTIISKQLQTQIEVLLSKSNKTGETIEPKISETTEQEDNRENHKIQNPPTSTTSSSQEAADTKKSTNVNSSDSLASDNNKKQSEQQPQQPSQNSGRVLWKQELDSVKREVSSIREETNNLMKTIIGEKDVWKKEIKSIKEKMGDGPHTSEDIAIVVGQLKELRKTLESNDEELRGYLAEFQDVLETKVSVEDLEELKNKLNEGMISMARKEVKDTMEQLRSQLGNEKKEKESDQTPPIDAISKKVYEEGISQVRLELDRVYNDVIAELNNKANHEDIHSLNEALNEVVGNVDYRLQESGFASSEELYDRLNNLKSQLTEKIQEISDKQDELTQAIDKKIDLLQKQKGKNNDRHQLTPNPLIIGSVSQDDLTDLKNELTSTLVKKDQLPFLLEALLVKSEKISQLQKSIRSSDKPQTSNNQPTVNYEEQISEIHQELEKLRNSMSTSSNTSTKDYDKELTAIQQELATLTEEVNRKVTTSIKQKDFEPEISSLKEYMKSIDHKCIELDGRISQLQLKPSPKDTRKNSKTSQSQTDKVQSEMVSSLVDKITKLQLHISNHTVGKTEFSNEVDSLKEKMQELSSLIVNQKDQTGQSRQISEKVEHLSVDIALVKEELENKITKLQEQLTRLEDIKQDYVSIVHDSSDIVGIDQNRITRLEFDTEIASLQDQIKRTYADIKSRLSVQKSNASPSDIKNKLNDLELEKVNKVDLENMQKKMSNETKKAVENVKAEISDLSKTLGDKINTKMSQTQVKQMIESCRDSLSVKISRCEDRFHEALKDKIDKASLEKQLVDVMKELDRKTGEKNMKDKLQRYTSQERVQELKQALVENVQAKVIVEDLKNELAELKKRFEGWESNYTQKLKEKASVDHVTQVNNGITNYVTNLIQDKVSKSDIDGTIKAKLNELDSKISNMSSGGGYVSMEQLLEMEQKLTEKIQLASVVKVLTEDLEEQRKLNIELKNELERVGGDPRRLERETETLKNEVQALKNALNRRNGSLLVKVLSCFGLFSCFGAFDNHVV